LNQQNEFALITNIIHQEWTGLTVNKHKLLKGLKSQNLRDHMSEAELDLYSFGGTFYQIDSRNYLCKRIKTKFRRGEKGGKIAKDAKQALEAKTGKQVVTAQNFLAPVKSAKRLKK
jgi:hypothetical protein